MIKTRTWVIIIVIFLALSLIACCALSHGRNSAHIANIFINGESVYSVDLGLISTPEEKRFDLPDGSYNTIQLESGRIRISDADCKDKICMHTGWISDSFYPIVCLPHKFIVKIDKKTYESTSEFDSIVQ